MPTSSDTHKHVNPVLVFIILVIATAIEVAAAMFGNLPMQTLAPLLIGITVVKSALVALYFMHLRYEKAVYGLLFIAPLLFGLFLASVLLPLT
ncbi:MAG TPA: cytochrome C oxidase subunit IV family protein [Thermoflexales bacterium]|nr:cytochrome C oxidase subunit IV family protein [Thermoflexales bacterium]HQW34229.1 cytochrome C oxidase subunit IV family protein [Thermoflexales bacterium]HQZ20674.1 cytochrome C oxidase subunit IV family protein [Thermoflexales bacterium]HQZ99190.1 cytochrome C oxidase subunit IV family protein [Thermoflexales bacterium]